MIWFYYIYYDIDNVFYHMMDDFWVVIHKVYFNLIIVLWFPGFLSTTMAKKKGPITKGKWKT